MFRIVCDPSSGSIKLYLTEIRSGSLMFVVCLIGVYAPKHRLSTRQTSVNHYEFQSSTALLLPDDGSHTIRNMSE